MRKFLALPFNAVGAIVLIISVLLLAIAELIEGPN